MFILIFSGWPTNLLEHPVSPLHTQAGTFLVTLLPPCVQVTLPTAVFERQQHLSHINFKLLANMHVNTFKH